MASGVPDDGGFRRSEERRRNRIEESEERVDLVTPCDCERTADSRKRIYDLCKLVDTRAASLAFMDRYIDRELAEAVVDLLAEVVEDNAQQERAVAARQYVGATLEDVAGVAVLALGKIAAAAGGFSRFRRLGSLVLASRRG